MQAISLNYYIKGTAPQQINRGSLSLLIKYFIETEVASCITALPLSALLLSQLMSAAPTTCSTVLEPASDSVAVRCDA